MKIEDKIINIDVQDLKITKRLPKKWKVKTEMSKDGVDVTRELSVFCLLLYNNLRRLKDDYEEEFNQNNSFSIDEYIQFFNSIYEKIVQLVCNGSTKRSYKKEKNEYRDSEVFYRNDRFQFIKKIDNLRRNLFSSNCDKQYLELKDKEYNELNSLVKNLFVIEKLCSFTVRKFWTNELTKINDLDMSKQFKILVHVVVQNGWRKERLTQEKFDYYQNKKYACASLVDQDHLQNIFKRDEANITAALILDVDANDIVTASHHDANSEEVIDGKNPLENKYTYSDIFLQDIIEDRLGQNKFYSEAVEIENPKALLRLTRYFSEVSLKNAKVVGVLVPNQKSYQFCVQEAEKRNVPLFIPENVKREIELEEENKVL